MKDVIIALKLTEYIPPAEADYIGADRGALVLADRGIRMKKAVGDFDSVSADEFSRIEKYAEDIIRLNPVKDDSDSEHAVVTALEMGYERLWLCGGLGGRPDHSFVNLQLTEKYAGHVFLIDRNTLITALKPGSYDIPKKDYAFISFFTFEEAVITLEGFKYPLKQRRITVHDMYTVSNEILGRTGHLEIQSGTVLVMQCGDPGRHEDEYSNSDN